MEVVRSDRGFRVLYHETYPPKEGEKSRLVQESSAIGPYEDAFENPGSSFLWVGDNHHLNREQIAELVMHLNHWLVGGRLRGDGLPLSRGNDHE